MPNHLSDHSDERDQILPAGEQRSAHTVPAAGNIKTVTFEGEFKKANCKDEVVQEQHLPPHHARSMPNLYHVLNEASDSDSDVNGRGSRKSSKDTSPAVVEVKAFSAPGEIWGKVVATGAQKSAQGPIRLILLSMLAGAYIGLGFSLCMIGAGQISVALRGREPGLFNILYGIYGFPFGLSLVVLAGAELFTSNVMFMTAAWLDRKVSGLAALSVCIVCYLANLAGSLFLVRLMVWGHVFTGREAFTVSLGVKKVGLGFTGALVRGVLCNWLVCLAVWQATGAQDITGKAVGIFLPISAFVSSGYEHSVANMFGVPLGIALGAPFGFWDFVVKNLVPVTIGNIISAGVFVALIYSMCYGTAGKTAERRLHAAVKSSKKKARAAVRKAHAALAHEANSHVPNGTAPALAKANSVPVSRQLPAGMV